MSKPHSTPSAVNAEDGEVLIDGPNGVAVSFTPEAAVETSERLVSASAAADRQRKQRD